MIGQLFKKLTYHTNCLLTSGGQSVLYTPRSRTALILAWWVHVASRCERGVLTIDGVWLDYSTTTDPPPRCRQPAYGPKCEGQRWCGIFQPQAETCTFHRNQWRCPASLVRVGSCEWDTFTPADARCQTGAPSLLQSLARTRKASTRY